MSAANNIHKWAVIARDIALTLIPQVGTSLTPEFIAQTYGMTEDELAELLRFPMFKELVKKEKQRIDELGPNAALRIRAEVMAADVQETLHRKMKADRLEPKDMLKFLEILNKCAGVDEKLPSEHKKSDVGGNVVNFMISVPTLNNPKLNHIRSSPVAEIVDLEAVSVDGTA